jgi:hypothetical protein
VEKVDLGEEVKLAPCTVSSSLRKQMSVRKREAKVWKVKALQCSEKVQRDAHSSSEMEPSRGKKTRVRT